jgi:hypothetical protein
MPGNRLVWSRPFRLTSLTVSPTLVMNWARDQRRVHELDGRGIRI